MRDCAAQGRSCSHHLLAANVIPCCETVTSPCVHQPQQVRQPCGLLVPTSQSQWATSIRPSPSLPPLPLFFFFLTDGADNAEPHTELYEPSFVSHTSWFYTCPHDMSTHVLLCEQISGGHVSQTGQRPLTLSLVYICRACGTQKTHKHTSKRKQGCGSRVPAGYWALPRHVVKGLPISVL